MGTLGWPELIIIAIIALLLFGAKKLPELARSVGSGIKEFKKAVAETTEDVTKPGNDKSASE